MSRYIEFDELSEAPVPVHAVAFDVIEGREVLLSDGPTLEAIAAGTPDPRRGRGAARLLSEASSRTTAAAAH